MVADSKSKRSFNTKEGYTKVIREKDLEFLYDFYQKINNKNAESNLDSEFRGFKEEGDVKYDLKSDVLDEIIDDFKAFEESLKLLRKIDTTQSIVQIDSDKNFNIAIVHLAQTFQSLSIDFDYLNYFHIEFMRNLPDDVS